MSATLLLAPSQRLARTAFPEREDRAVPQVDQWALALLAGLRQALAPPAARELTRLARRLEAAQAALRTASDAELVARLRALAPAAVRECAEAALHEVLVVAAEAAARSLAMRPYPTQLLGAAVLLRGQLAEMQTGEGKTLTAGLAACVAGCAGVPVHVATVNDYLAGRDAAQLAPLYAFAGLSVGVVRLEMEPPAKRGAYACDVTYGTGKDMVFDYLRDRVTARGRASAAQIRARELYGAQAEPLLMRGLHFAIVDEADSILIDEARTPLILAQKAGAVEHAEALPQALALAAELAAGDDYLIDAARRELRLTQRGSERLADLVASRVAQRELSADPWQARHAREHLVVQALRALHLFARDRQYLVDAEGAVQIIDEYTGRALPGRTWEQGLHQMIECKEGVALSERTRTLARITYQRFYTRYLRLAGMTGTARERARELAVSYRLDTVSVPTHRPSRRVQRAAVLCADEPAKWRAVAAEVQRRHARGQPVLVGTRSVEASEALARELAAAGLPHRVLNARQDADEAALVARAGEPGAITVATNMAGRGTDIVPGEGVAALGGLAVILTEYHESPRIDRQLFGRCARQGEPGECVAVVAAADDLMRHHAGAWRQRLLAVLAVAPVAGSGSAARSGGWPARLWLAHCRRVAQARAERMHARTRRDANRQDRELERSIGFSGDPL